MRPMRILNHSWYAVPAGLVGLFLAAWAMSSSAGTAGDPQRGKVVYEKNCQGGHGRTGAGVGGATPSLTDAARMATKSDVDLFDAVTTGRPGTGMPAWGSILNERDRWNVVAYIRTFAAPP